MARTDAVVLGAGIVGTSVALHLVKRGLGVTLVDRAGPGEGTSYGNAGVIEGNTLLPYPFPKLGALLRIAFGRATDARYHLAALPRLAPWLYAYRANSTMARRILFANHMRPMFAAALAEHEALMAEAGATHLLRKEGWLKIYRSEADYQATAPERELAKEFGLPFETLDRAGALALEPSLAPVFSHGVLWTKAASVTNPLALTRAYLARFTALGGVVLSGDARSLHRAGERWRVDTAGGPVDAREAVVALGPWAQDLLDPLGVKLPLAVKRGYHRHFQPRGNAGLTRPVLDVGNSYILVPMQQGIRLTTGAEFAARDAKPTPVQLAKLMPTARALFPLGEPVEAQPWMGSRPCFPDSMPVIGRAPGHADLWLAYGHAHWGLTLGPATGRLLAQLVTGETPFCDPTPFAAERFQR